MDRRAFVGLGCAAILLGGCPQRKQARQSANFNIDWTPGVDYIGFFIAREEGLFSRAGYDVGIIPGQGAEAAAQQFAAGKIDFGTTTIDAYLNAYRTGLLNGADVARVAAIIFQKNPVVLLSSNARPVAEATDLRGRRIGFSEKTSVTYRQLEMLVRSGAGIPPGKIHTTVYDRSGPIGADEVNLVEVSYEGPKLLMSGELDSIVAYATDAPVELRLQGFSYQQRFMSEFGLDMAGMCVCVSPALVRRGDAHELVAAACQGWDDVRQDPDRAVATFAALYPEIRKETATLALDQTLPLLPATGGFDAYGARPVLVDALTRSNNLLDRMSGKRVPLDLQKLLL